MEATIAHFRQSRHTQNDNQMIVIAGAESREKARELVGKTVTWKSSGKEPVKITGKVTGAHGNSGALKVVFEKGMPGQSIGARVTIE
ncbi:MAG: 50S ribosomal protein L35ae [archaeon]